MTLTSIALQNLRQRKGKTAFLLLTFILITGISVALNSLSQGVKGELEKSLSQYGANVIISPKSEQFSLSYGGLSLPGVHFETKTLDYASVTKLENPNLILKGIAPKIIGSASGKDNPYLIVGVDFSNELKMKPWWHIDGHLPKGGEVIIGSDLAVSNQLGIGQTLELNHRNYKIAGIMEKTGGSEDIGVFTNFTTAQLITGINSWSMIEVSAAEPSQAVAILREILPEAKVAEISQLVEGREKSIEGFSRFSLALSLLLALIGGLIVFLTTTSMIHDRTSEIGIMKALGFRRRHILAIFMREIFLISLLGGSLGYLLGSLAALLLAPITYQASLKFQIHPLIALTAITTSVIIGVVSTFLSAQRGVNLEPIKALAAL
ncbi:ABC-type transport system, involved in lipoprotein release, permease component [Desulfosporosinus orientis DSM 765]|uniref:ABC-type transport system, involved in lipoprotein release, permease component n=1 Tax=Desulfosporosinus orientis (strain ATCC 19365 / DSM 765 / NCIMB 8382 / VKM B-1628 / Singapore I) TaxID=768706 RepID=G7WCE3_DESOD|nr:FtsX-like permease family protein [Desulfosporosinus orientis]AET66265.1 ABC-type transport system, involved in lipoprotein release, permease component [Desulfosporosinus orientis DSM 765]